MLVILTSCHPSHPYRGVTVTAAGSWGWARTKQWGMLAGCSVFECGGGVGDVMSVDVYSGGGGGGMAGGWHCRPVPVLKPVCSW